MILYSFIRDDTTLPILTQSLLLHLLSRNYFLLHVGISAPIFWEVWLLSFIDFFARLAMLISISFSLFFPFWLRCMALYILHAPDRPTQIITGSRGWCDTLIWYKPWRLPHITFMWRVCLRYNCRRSCSDSKGIASCQYWCLSLLPKCSLA